MTRNDQHALPSQSPEGVRVRPSDSIYICVHIGLLTYYIHTEALGSVALNICSELMPAEPAEAFLSADARSNIALIRKHDNFQPVWPALARQRITLSTVDGKERRR